MRNRWVLISAVVVATSCSVEPQLLPDKTTQRSEGPAAASLSGVQVRVDGDAWRGQPDRLPEVVTPVKVTIENSSGRPLRIAYVDFSLDGKKHYRALPMVAQDVPVSLRQNAPALRRVLNEAVAPPTPADPQRPKPRFQSKGFFVAQFYRKQYPAYEPWPRSINTRSPTEAIASSLLAADLPSADMVADGLPEGVLENGGFVTGYLFFDRVEPRETRVNFNLRLSDPDSTEQFGQITIPLAVEW